LQQIPVDWKEKTTHPSFPSLLREGKLKHHMDENTVRRGELLSVPVQMIASLRNEDIGKKVSGYSVGYLF